MKETDSRAIAQDFLDKQAEVTLAGDVEATLDFCDIPCFMESAEGSALATTRQEMRAICESFVNGLRFKELTHMVRTVRAAEFIQPDRIRASYETRYIRDNRHLTEDPYEGVVILLRRDGRWKISSMQLSASGASPPNKVLRDHARRDAL